MNTDPFSGIISRVNQYIAAGCDVVIPDGHIINKAERAARAVVDAELPTMAHCARCEEEIDDCRCREVRHG